MAEELNEFEDKQRIVVVDMEGTANIIDIAAHVLQSCNRKFDLWFADGSKEYMDDAPLVLIQAKDEIDTTSGKATFLKYQHHIVVIHHVSETFPEAYGTFEEYVKQYEDLADLTPKAGSIIYNQDDNVANLVVGERERKDIKLIEYSKADSLDGHQSAARAMLGRVGITAEMFEKGITNYN